MSWLFENPLPILLVGLAVEAILVVVLFQTGRAATLLAMAGVALVTAALLAVEWFVVTDTERVESTLYAAAAALRNNDLDGVLKYISDDAPAVRQAVQNAFARFTVVDARISSTPRIRINRLTNPPTATAQFFGRIRVRARRGAPLDGPHVGRFAIDLEWDAPRWRVTGYQLAR